MSLQLVIAQVLLLTLGLLGVATARPDLIVDHGSKALLALGVTASTLSAALSYGPPHAWAWLSLPVQVGLVAALLVAALLLPVPRRTCAALALLVLAVSLTAIGASLPGTTVTATVAVAVPPWPSEMT